LFTYWCAYSRFAALDAASNLQTLSQDLAAPLPPGPHASAVETLVRQLLQAMSADSLAALLASKTKSP
jgi:hypothetical protein